jgi:hypothetical protein
MHELQFALYESQRKYSKLNTTPPNTMLSNDCLDNEDVILSCCAGLVRAHRHPLEGLSLSFFRMYFSSQKQESQYTDHNLCRCPQIVRFRNTSSAFMATERNSYETTTSPSHVFNIDALITRRTAYASSANTHGATGFLTVVCVTPVMPKRLPDI